MTKDTGGQTYPTKLYTEQGYPGGYDMGMTLRDCFAGQALAAYIAKPDSDNYSYDSMADWAYNAADAMLAARQS